MLGQARCRYIRVGLLSLIKIENRRSYSTSAYGQIYAFPPLALTLLVSIDAVGDRTHDQREHTPEGSTPDGDG